MNTIVLESAVYYRQTVSTKVQEQNATEVQVRQAIPANHISPGLTAVAHMSKEVLQ